MKSTPILPSRIVVVAGVLLFAVTHALFALNSASGSPVVRQLATGGGEREIQRALDELPPEGGTVLLAAGTYAIEHPIRLDRSHVALRGSGPGTVLRLVDGANCPVVVLGYTAARPVQPVTNLCLADLMIDGNRRHQSIERWVDASNQSGIQNNGVMVQGISHSRVEHVTAAHCRSGGLVTANGTRDLMVKGFTAYDNQFDGLACYRTEDSTFTGLNLYDNQAAGISLDLEFNHNVISDSTLTANDLGIFMRRSSHNQFDSITILRSHHDGVFMAQWGTGSAAGWQLIPQTECAGNYFGQLDVYNCAGVAFRVHDAACVNNVIEDGVFSGNLKGGIDQARADLVRLQESLE